MIGAYSASKFAVRSLTQTAGTMALLMIIFFIVVTHRAPTSAQEWGVHGITVNAYAPGAIETAMRRLLSCSVYIQQHDDSGPV